ncbi:MAG: hypothetical protein O3A00_22140, partial [Planctomycetota bacterium]|nr:hypothetical protein [Planctomycetota bacterium]
MQDSNFTAMIRTLTLAGLVMALSCPNARAIDLVEVQVRNTCSDEDDFVTWAPAKCRIRVKPGTSLTDDLKVVLTNDPEQAPPPGRLTPLDSNVAFAASVAPGKTATKKTLELTLPKSGEWIPFVIAGKFGRPSQRLDDAVIQIHRDAADGDLVGTETLMVRIRKDAATLTVYERDELLDAVATLKEASGGYDLFLEMHLKGDFSITVWNSSLHDRQ